MAWKKATKRQMPAVGRSVLVWIRKAPIAIRCQFTATWDGKEWRSWEYHTFMSKPIPGVTYWRELPPGPKQARRR
jgi:hypothetical protein